MVFDVLQGGHLVESGVLAAASGVMGDGELRRGRGGPRRSSVEPVKRSVLVNV